MIFDVWKERGRSHLPTCVECSKTEELLCTVHCSPFLLEIGGSAFIRSHFLPLGLSHLNWKSYLDRRRRLSTLSLDCHVPFLWRLDNSLSQFACRCCSPLTRRRRVFT